MTIAPITQHFPYQPVLQALLAPVKIIYGLFLQALGYLLSFLCLSDWGKSLKDRGARISIGCLSLLQGLWAYGCRLRVPSHNYDEACRGSSYLFIERHLADPQKSLEAIAEEFEEGPPESAVQLHVRKMIPTALEEKRFWKEEIMQKWPKCPILDPGAYMFLVGYSRDANHPGKAHLFVLIRQNETSYLFDPNTGLSVWESADWEPLLDRIGSGIRTSPAGYFTLEGYCYSRNSSLPTER